MNINKKLERIVELRWKEYQLRKLGETTLKAAQGLTYIPGNRFIDGAVELVPIAQLESVDQGPEPRPDSYLD